MTTDMGPLPLGDRKDTQQQLSLKSLRNRIPEDKFLVRDERTDDKGVDVALEAKIEARVPKKGGGEEVMSGFTNCRAQGQLKSIDNPVPNGDGSVSYSIDTSNLNYLLNGQSPLYFLWLAPTDQVRYAWARDEWRRLDQDQPGWMDQGTFTIRFSEVLDAAAVDAIHERVIREARFARDISETLARASLSESVVVSVNPKTLETTDPLKLYVWISASGMTLVSSGYGKQVLERFHLLNPEHRREARVNLVAAYANVSISNNHEAVAKLAVAMIGAANLSSEDRDFLAYLDDVCQYRTGRIDQTEYLRRESERGSKGQGVSAAGHSLEVLRLDRLRSRDRGRRAELLEQMRCAAAAVESAADAKEAHKLNARIHILNADGDELTGMLISEFVQARVREDMGVQADALAEEARERSIRLWTDWGNRAEACIEGAAADGHPLLLADAITTKATIYQAVVMNDRMRAATAETIWQAPEEMIRASMGDVERARGIYTGAGNLEGETRSQLLLADLFDSLGQSDAAKKLAEGAVVVAQAMGYAQLESHALEHIQDQTVFRQFQRAIAERAAVDEDVHAGYGSDEAVRGVAELTLASLGLPADRLQILVREADSCRRVARERVEFCRHIQLIQDFTHMQSQATCYAQDPARAGYCDKLGHTSQVRSTDTEAVIAAFKAAYCDKCPERLPKGR